MYTWLESYGSEDSHGKRLNKIGVTIWLPEFCQHFGSEIITPAETLSYKGLGNVDKAQNVLTLPQC